MLDSIILTGTSGELAECEIIFAPRLLRLIVVNFIDLLSPVAAYVVTERCRSWVVTTEDA